MTQTREEVRQIVQIAALLLQYKLTSRQEMHIRSVIYYANMALDSKQDTPPRKDPATK